MTDVFTIADILVGHAVERYGDDIGIIAYYGSHAKGTATAGSDLDLFYMPDEGKADDLAMTFVLDGLPYDFWPVSWLFAEAIANARSGRPWAVSASLIADAKVLYHRSTDDRARFEALQARVAELTRPDSRAYMVERALEAFKNVLARWGQLQLALEASDAVSARTAAQELANAAANCVALVNQTYFSKGWGANLPEILALSDKPAGFDDSLLALLAPEADGDLGSAARRLVANSRRFLLAAQASTGETAAAQDIFTDFYFHIVEYRQKVLSACARGSTVAAAHAAYQLQDVTCWLMHKVTHGFHPTDFNLISEYTTGYEAAGFPDLLTPAYAGDLDELALRANLLEETMRAWLAQQDIALNVLAGEDDLRRFLAG